MKYDKNTEEIKMTHTKLDWCNTQRHLFKQLFLPKAYSAWLLYKSNARH